MILILVPAVQIRALLLIPQQHLYAKLVYLKYIYIYIYIYISAALKCNIIDRSNI